MVLIRAVVGVLVVLAWGGMGAEGAGKHRVYVRLMDSREHPDYGRRHVQPPSWETFANRTHFACLRGFEVKDGVLVNFGREIDKYTKQFELGDVIWPSYPILFAKNVGALADEIKKRNLFLFDIWGYVPGSGPGGYWQQFKPPAGVLEMFEAKLGERWLGMDVGEQDGRYVGGYASQMMPASASRIEQYLNFQRHFERMCDELGNKMCTLVSLNFGHYFLKEGVYSAIGAETAQALPNSQVYYAFIRGAGKQYGVPWFGNASVWNRWGWKTYAGKGASNGPTKGTSLNLLKRLLYSHILYNCTFVGFESGWFEGDVLSPIGRIQQAARQWVGQNGQPGVMVTPIAVMADFFSGWSFPRHLYSQRVYRVWGNLPYEAGDHMTDGVLDMLYPGYQDSSYFHDERGFMTATPYGDAADCILSDAESWLLRQYATVVVAGELSGGAEIRDKLATYVAGGGHVVITAGSLRKLPGGLGGVRIREETVGMPPGTKVRMDSSTVTEDRGFALHRLEVPADTRVLATCGDMPAAVEVASGKGSVLVLASPFGIGPEPSTKGVIANAVDKQLAKPFPLLAHVRALLDEVFRREMLFEAGEGLSLITCRKEAGQYILGVCNNSLEQRPLKIVSHCGLIESVKELSLDQSEKTAVGLLPEGFEKAAIGQSEKEHIAGGDVRIFSVRVREEDVEEIARAVPEPRSHGRLLPLRGVNSIKEEVLSRPTFFEHFDGVVVDWRYLGQREKGWIKKEAGWVGRQGLDVVVDLSSAVNLYPDLRLVNNAKEEYAASLAAIEDVVAKMEILGARDLIVSLHRHPENNFTQKQAEESFVATLRALCAHADAHKVRICLRLVPNKPPWDVATAVQFVEKVGASNLFLAPSTGTLLGQNADPEVVKKVLTGKLVGLWLVSGSRVDIAGHLWDVHAPLADQGQKEKMAAYLSIAPKAKAVLDAAYGSRDEEYQAVRTLEDIQQRLRGE